MQRIQLPDLRTNYIGQSCTILEEIDSTNNWLKENARNLPSGACVVAHRQTAGKGRMGREWNSRKGAGLYLSVLLASMDMKDMPRLPLLAGTAVCRALEQLCAVRFSMKWSNDVLAEDKKVCGILCESRAISGKGHAVVGIGINLAQNEKEFTESGLLYATSLWLVTGKLVSPLDVASGVCNCLETALEDYRTKGFDSFCEEYRKRCITLGKEVRVLQQGNEITAFARDIGEDGSLICVGQNGEELIIRAGEASVRGLYGYA